MAICSFLRDTVARSTKRAYPKRSLAACEHVPCHSFRAANKPSEAQLLCIIGRKRRKLRYREETRFLTCVRESRKKFGPRMPQFDLFNNNLRFIHGGGGRKREASSKAEVTQIINGQDDSRGLTNRAFSLATGHRQAGVSEGRSVGEGLQTVPKFKIERDTFWVSRHRN